MLELRIMNAGTALPLFDLPAALGRRNAAREVGDTIDALIAFMDDLGGDPESEDGGDDEEDGTHADSGWTEWHTRGSHKLEREAELLGRDANGNQMLEDDEDDDADTSVEDDPAGVDPEEDFGAEESGEEEQPSEEFTSQEAMEKQRDRIRYQRCDMRRDRWGDRRWTLPTPANDWPEAAA